MPIIKKGPPKNHMPVGSLSTTTLPEKKFTEWRTMTQDSIVVQELKIVLGVKIIIHIIKNKFSSD